MKTERQRREERELRLDFPRRIWYNNDIMRCIIPNLKPKNIITALVGSAILAFGLFNIHSFSGVTEGGVLGLTLLLHNWFGISPSVSSVVMNVACYALGWKLLGKEFICYSAVAGGGFSVFYAIFEKIGPLFPHLTQNQFACSVVGALFVGVGVGLAVRAGGAPGGDDALAMSLAHVTHLKLEWLYLISDLIVLVLSLTYIPPLKLLYSLFTVVISGQLIGLIQKIPEPCGKNPESE